MIVKTNKVAWLIKYIGGDQNEYKAGLEINQQIINIESDMLLRYIQLESNRKH